MPGEIAEFDIQLRKEFAALVPGGMKRAMQKISLDLSSRLIFRSPVKTGRFRGNWHPSEGQVSRVAFMNTFDPDGSGTLAKIEAALATISGKEPVHIQNNVPYSIFLLKGGSTQAPSGWVEGAIREVQETIVE